MIGIFIQPWYPIPAEAPPLRVADGYLNSAIYLGPPISPSSDVEVGRTLYTYGTELQLALTGLSVVAACVPGFTLSQSVTALAGYLGLSLVLGFTRSDWPFDEAKAHRREYAPLSAVCLSRRVSIECAARVCGLIPPLVRGLWLPPADLLCFIRGRQG